MAAKKMVANWTKKKFYRAIGNLRMEIDSLDMDTLNIVLDTAPRISKTDKPLIVWELVDWIERLDNLLAYPGVRETLTNEVLNAVLD